MAAKQGTLIVKSHPSGATATIDNESKITPTIFGLRIRPLPYDVKIEKAGFDDYIHKVIIKNDVEIEIDVTLTKTI